MVGLDENIFVFSDLSKEQMKAKIDSNFESDLAMYLNKKLGSSSSSSSSSDDGDSSSDDGGGYNSSSDDDDDDDGDSSFSGSDDGDDSDTVSDTVSGDDGEVEDDGVEDEEEDKEKEDIHLKMFLENIEADGTSYVLKRDGKPDLRFEGLDEDADGSCGFDDNEVDDQAVVISSDCESEGRRNNGLDVRSGGRKGKGIFREDGMGNSRGVEDNGNVERRAKGVKNVGKKQTFEGYGKRVLVDALPAKRGGKNVERGKDCLAENVKRRERDVKNSEMKQTFVENRKYRSVEEVALTQVKRGKNVDKKSFVENESNSSGKEVDIKLDGTRLSRNVKENEKLERKRKNVEKLKKKKICMEYGRNYIEDDVDLSPDGRRFQQNIDLEKGAKDVKKKKSFKENERDSSSGELGLRLGNPGKVPYKRKRCLSEKFSEQDPDPEYKTFFDHCEIKKDSLVFFADGKRVIYGDDDSISLSDSEVHVSDHAPDCIDSNHAPTLNSPTLNYNAHMEEDDLQCLGSFSATENPEFRKALMDALQQPFNQNEYVRLRQEVKQRKLTVRHVDMRSGNTSFQQSTMGKSYLDHYADLKKQYDAFRNDIPKRLNILRGFFFYLKRMADDGKFKPWLDDSCLAIIPRTA